MVGTCMCGVYLCVRRPLLSRDMQHQDEVTALIDGDYYLHMLDLESEADNDAVMRLEPSVQQATERALTLIAQSGADAHFGVPGIEAKCRSWLIKNQEYRCPLYGAVAAHLHATMLSEPTSAYESVLLPATLLGWLPALSDVYVRRYTQPRWVNAIGVGPETRRRYVQARDSFHAEVAQFQPNAQAIVTDVVYFGHLNLEALRTQIRRDHKRQWAEIERRDPTARWRRF